MEKSTKNNIQLGIFVVAGVFLFVLAMYLIGQKQDMFGSTVRINAVFNNVNGLQAGNNVRLAGIGVGTVNEVKITSDSTVLVAMDIQKDAQKFIKNDALAIIGTDGLIGNQIINIGSGSPGAPAIEEGGTLRTNNMVLTDDVFRTLAETNVNVAIVAENLATTIQDISDGKGPIGKLIKDEKMAHNLQNTMVNVDALSQSMRKISENVEQTLTQINIKETYENSLLSDTALANDIRQMVLDAKGASKNAEELTAELRVLIQELNAGKGTAGKLLKDTTVVHSLEESLNEIEAGAKSFKHNMDALQQNFFFRRYFRKMEDENSGE